MIKEYEVINDNGEYVLTEKISNCDESCIGCSYYDLTVIGILPFEYCYKHNKKNKKPCDFVRCNDYTTSKWVKIKTVLKGLF